MLDGCFNRADVSQLLSKFRLSRMNKFANGGDRTLDMILTILNTFYKDADRFPPFGLSDHHTVGIIQCGSDQFGCIPGTSTIHACFLAKPKRRMELVTM